MGKLKIGSVELPNPVILAPMAGVSDLPFRLLCREQGAGLVCMEMVSAKAIAYHNRNTERLMEINDREHPVSLQLFGSEPDLMAEIAAQIEDKPFDILDINMGCPVPKIVGNGEGSALMKNPKLIEEIITKVSRAIKKPLTVKFRKGFDDDHVNAVEIAKIAEASGAAAVAVHGRTREQFYSGTADWEIIRQVKGRAARGNPWLFHRVAEYLETGKLLDKPSGEEIKAMMFRHARMQVACKGDYTGIREMRKHISWYTTGLPGSAKLRGKINSVESLQEMEELLQEM